MIGENHVEQSIVHQGTQGTCRGSPASLPGILAATALILGLAASGCGERATADREPSASPAPPAEALALWGYTLDVLDRNETALQLHHEDEDGGVYLSISIARAVEERHARQIVDTKVHLFRTMFSPSTTGYPGHITQEIECPAEYLPEYHEAALDGGQVRYFIASANANRVAGACSPDLVRHTCWIGHVICEPDLLVHGQACVSPERRDLLDAFMTRVDCNGPADAFPISSGPS